jgi:DNA repair exonuclease SbcCD nuclease subunit
MKPFRLLVTADNHVGKNQYSSFTRTEDFAAALPQIVQIAKGEKVDLVVCAGDLADSYNIGAYSSRAIRKFCEALDRADIAALVVEGNHDAARSNQEGRAVARIDSLSDTVLRPSNLDEWTKGWMIKIVAADWMPASRVQDSLDTVPPATDVLVLHQSCEGFIPSIGAVEVRHEQLLGSARLVCIGDLHVSATQTLSDGTILVSPGPSELCASNEDPNKSVSIVDYDIENHKVLEIRKVSLKTRRVLKLKVFDELGLASADLDLRASLEANPLTFIEHGSAVRPLLDQKLEEWKALGLSLIFPEPAVEIKESESYLATRKSADREMEEIIGEALQEHPEEAAAAAALWKTPGASEEIIAQLEKTIRNAHN